MAYRALQDPPLDTHLYLLSSLHLLCPLPVLKQGKTALTLAPYGLCIYALALPFARRTLFF